MKNIVISRWMVLLFPLLSCYASPSPNQPFTIEESEDDQQEIMDYIITNKLPNHEYVILWDIINQFEVFYKESLTTDNPYALLPEETQLKEKWDSNFQEHQKQMDILIGNIKLRILNLILGEETIDQFLDYMLDFYGHFILFRVGQTLDFFSKLDMGLFMPPTGEPLFDFLMAEEAIFGGCEAINKKKVVSLVGKWTLLVNLIQETVKIAEKKGQLNGETTKMIASYGLDNDYNHPDAIGGPYALLEDLFHDQLAQSAPLSARRRLHIDEIKKLIGFDTIYNESSLQKGKQPVDTAKSRVLVIVNVLSAIRTSKNPYVSYHLLNLMKDKPLKIWIGGELPSYVEATHKTVPGVAGEKLTIITALPAHIPKPINQQMKRESEWIKGSLVKKIHRKNRSLCPSVRRGKGKRRVPHMHIQRKMPVSIPIEIQPIQHPSDPAPANLKITLEEQSSIENLVSLIESMTVDLEPIAENDDIKEQTLTAVEDSEVNPLTPVPVACEEVLAREEIREDSAGDLLSTTTTIQGKPKKESKYKPTIVGQSNATSQAVMVPATPQPSVKAFVFPAGLRSLHTEMIGSALPLITNPKNQRYIDRLFGGSAITFNLFVGKIWDPNGGAIKTNSGSHYSLLFNDKKIGGIYRPHGKDDVYSDLSLRYLQSYVFFIGLRPSG